MAIDEGARHALRRRLDEVLGPEHALTLMDHLPGAEIATSRDVTALEERMDGRFTALEARMDLKLEALEHRVTTSFRAELVTQTRTFVAAMVGSMATVATLAFAAARLT